MKLIRTDASNLNEIIFGISDSYNLSLNRTSYDGSILFKYFLNLPLGNSVKMSSISKLFEKNTSNYNQTSGDLIGKNQEIQIIISSMCYFVTVLLCLFLNILVLTLIVTYKTSKPVSIFFMVNLILADSVFILLCIPANYWN